MMICAPICKRKQLNAIIIRIIRIIIIIIIIILIISQQDTDSLVRQGLGQPRQILQCGRW